MSHQKKASTGVARSVARVNARNNRNVKRFRGGLVLKAHGLLYHSTLGMGVIKKKKHQKKASKGVARSVARATLEATQGQFDIFFSQLPYKCHQNRVASVGD